MIAEPHAQSLMTGLVYHRPEDPIAFLQDCLEEAKEREGQYSWNCFITTTNSRSVFSRTKPLPPIQKPASAATPKEKCTEPFTVEHTPPRAGDNRGAAVQDKPLVFIIGTHDDHMAGSWLRSPYWSACRWPWVWEGNSV